ncbi:MAG: hypothetical protein AAF928_02075 [Myxococcota bacterium]
MKEPRATGPGIAKVRRGGPIARRTVELVALREGWWSALFARADIVSEGAVVAEPGGRRVYYGSTSLHVGIPAADVEMLGATAGATAAPGNVTPLVLADPHARLRLVRLARNEAAARAGASLATMSAEVAAEVALRAGRPWILVAIDVGAALVDEGVEAG